MASRSKRRKLNAVAAVPKSDADRVADVTYRELYAALSVLGQLQKKQHNELELLADNLAEISLRVRYVMQHFKFEKGSRMLGLDGQPIPGEIATLFDRYTAERDRFMASLVKDMTDAQAVDQNGRGEASESAAAHAGSHAAAAATPEPASTLRLAHSS